MRKLAAFAFFLVCTIVLLGQQAFANEEQGAGKGAEQGAGKGVGIAQSLEQAFSYSPNLQRMQEARNEAEHEVRRAEAGYYPTIGIWAGGGIVQESTEATRFNDTNSKGMGNATMGLAFSQTIWQGGATPSLVRSREASLSMSVFDVLDTASALALNTIGSHVDVVRRRTLLSLAENNVVEHQKILRILRSRFNQGLSSKGDLEQVISRLNRAEAIRLTHKQGLGAALANYRRLTGQTANAKLAEVTNPVQIFEDTNSVRESTLQNNYTLQANMAQVEALLGERDFTRANFAPSLSLDAGPSYTNTDRGGDAHDLSLSVMLNMRWNLYNGGADQAGFAAASAQVRQARKALHDTMDALDEQITLVYDNTTTAREQAVFFDAASTASKLAKDNFALQFQAGQKDLLNVLDAETEYFTAAVETVIARTDAVLGQYRMHALAGSLLVTMNIDSGDVSKGLADKTDLDKVTPWSFQPSPKEHSIANTSDSTLQRD